MDRIPVSELLSEQAKPLRLKLIYGKGQVRERYITSFRIQKPGLGLAGYTEHIHGGRVQILGNTEISYLKTLSSEKRAFSISNLARRGLCCFVVTKNLNIPKELLSAVREHDIPLLRTDLVSSKAIEEITAYLSERLAPETTTHGVMMDVFGIGTLILGRSGIGKSECAVELIKRGHRLVADDAVTVRKKQDYLVACSNDLLRHHLEVRGLGILNIKDMFGVTAIRQKKKVEMVIRFVDWDEAEGYDRLGLERNTYELLDTMLPMIILPITAGRNMAVIVEVAARNHLLKLMGYDSARDFSERLMKRINPGRKSDYETFEEEIIMRNIMDRGEE
ncbi:HPr(Ser) kinase/phosphatase [Limisalsivibrio acetivorans]|uniref:HPr(Ser) kinase/phosphatase n=1 Tax=Limisalsivibrio acetivorans TaxID=1304888 RepID=UPI0003B6E181|nr:HPr(Ser) kinase/phosphatase [Limisalsivibrio acetivorans]